MRNRSMVLALIACAACGGGSDDDSGGVTPPPAQQFGEVRGRVEDQTNAGIGSVGVTLTRSGFTTRNATTTAAGAFAFANVETGSWTATAAVPSGYTANGSTIATVQVAANQTVDVPAFRMTATAPPPPPPPPPPPVTEAEVEIRDNSFSPVTVSITRGGKVRWTNAGQAAHTSTSSNNWDSGALNPGQSFERTFNTAGTFDYVCTLHAGMNGTVVVQ